MVSAIDATKPIYGTPTTESVRNNFLAARDEISALQAADTTFLPLAGGTMSAPLILYGGDPGFNNEAVSKIWVLNALHSTVNALIYVGDYDAAADVVLTSGQPTVIVGQPLPAASSANTQFYFTAKTGHASPGIGHQPPGGVPAGSWLISNGVNWNAFQVTVAGVDAHSVPVLPPISGAPGDNVYDVLSSLASGYLSRAGGTMTGSLKLFADPTLNNEATTKHYVDSSITANMLVDAPSDGYSYTRQNGTWDDSPKFSNPLQLDMPTTTDVQGLNITTANANRWQLMVDASDDFRINRFDNAGTMSMVLWSERLTNFIHVNGRVVLDSTEAGAVVLAGRTAAPASGANDSFNIYGRNGAAAGIIALRGPGYSGNPSGVEIVANNNQNWKFDASGNLTVPNSIQVPAGGSYWLSSARLNVDGSNNTVFWAQSGYRFWNSAAGDWVFDGPPSFQQKLKVGANGVLVIGNTTDFYLSADSTSRTLNFQAGYAVQFMVATGLMRFVQNNGQSFSVDYQGNGQFNGAVGANNNINTAQAVVAQTGVFFGYGPVSTFVSYADGGGQYHQWQTGWTHMFNRTNGTQVINRGGPDWFVKRAGDGVIYNNIANLGGIGPYADYSDIRGKETVRESLIGLEAINKLKPVSFVRKRRDLAPEGMERGDIALPDIIPKREIGFIAQDLQQVIPEAVIPFEDIESDDPGLAIFTTPIVAALVNAVKQLSEEIAAIKGAM